jgi:hypothetical protein
MSHQAQPDVVGGAANEPAEPVAGQGQQPVAYMPQTPGTPVSYPPPFHGRPVSWTAVSIVWAGFLCGGIALIVGHAWWAFWLGVGLAVIGALLAAATNIFDDWY